ncbi:hypothetical protein M011DRAFT_85585 [Sporormia fimetaria CBS 119925]|uniref:Uncharacterized protein n=1 Tax=Sporormia fimetaria CBS 119925 TaxID=1340428 RepID=A0A6A6V9W0_9PLEO|nr:hypothetical protein M011DRAFT_85585 [Sporormia fimetaria CBS 119925]
MSETSTLVDWQPKDQEEVNLKETINQLFNVASEKAIVQVPVVGADNKATEETKPQFILKTRGYYDVKAYVAAGMLFPKVKEDFYKLHPKDQMKRLTEVDTEIYEETATAMVDVQNSCQNFNDQHMAKWLLVANGTIEYCQFAIDLLSGFEQGSFRALLDVLLDPKYSTLESQNAQEFQDAAQAANSIFTELSRNARDKATETNALIQDLEAFLGDTVANKTKIDFLKKQYITGPVTVGHSDVIKKGLDGNDQQPYSQYLQTSLDNLRKEIVDAVNQYNAAFDEWKHYTVVAATAVTYAWIPIYGWIAGGTVMGVYTDRARKAHERYETEKKKALEKKAEEGPLVNLIEDVSRLTSQQTAISTLMQSAIDALKEIRSLFLDQARNYGLAASQMGFANGRVRDSFFMRKTYMVQSVDRAVKNWQQVQDLAREFLESADLHTEGIAPGVTPPAIPGQ